MEYRRRFPRSNGQTNGATIEGEGGYYDFYTAGFLDIPYPQGGEPDVNSVAKIILNDFQRGRLPYFVKPPGMVRNTICILQQC